MDDSAYEQVPLAELRSQLGEVFDRASQTGEPVVVTRNGKPVGFLGPLEALHPEALPPAYFHAETRERGKAEVARYMAEHFSPEQLAEARAWAEQADTSEPPDDTHRTARKTATRDTGANAA